MGRPKASAPFVSNGLVTFKPNNLYVINVPAVPFADNINSAIGLADAGNIINLQDGTYNQRVVVSKSLTLDGQSEAGTILNGTGLVGTGSGITINNGITNVTIQDISIQNFAGAGPNSFAGIYATGGNNNLTVQNTTIKDNLGGSGFYANGPVDNVLLNNLDVSGHTNVSGAARGIVIWNGLKSNITITNCDVYDNNCCGIELQDGTASGVTMTGNNVYNNGDNGIGVVGLQGPGENLISGNTLTNNGRFGMEIKNPKGSGLATGAGHVVVENNTVSRNVAIGDARDIAGIAVFRRGVLAGNVDVPNGVVVQNNAVSGYVQPSTSEGFGIVIEGTNHTVTGNTVTGCEVGILQQQNPSGYPGDADQSNLADMFFGRGNSPITCGNTISGNTFATNTLDTRNIGVGGGIVTNTTTTEIFCSIQAAINDAQTVSGHTLEVSSSTYNEQVLVNKGVTIKGVGVTQPIVDFTGTVSGKPTLFDVSVDGVTIENIHFNVNLATLKSAIIASGTTIDNIAVKDNVIDAYGTPSSGTYSDRNAVSVNYTGNTNYRVATGGVNSVIFTGNTVNATAPSSAFRSGISVDEAGGTFSNNTLQTINHDILVRFASNGNITIDNNNFNGGGLELSDFNAGAGITTVSNNSFDATVANSSAPGTAVLRIKNNYNSKVHQFTSNTFTNFNWAVSLENTNSVTFDDNTFTGLAAASQAIHFNTKSISTNSNAIVQVPVGGEFTNNDFNGLGKALTFANHDSDNDSYGTITLGTAGNANTFASTLTEFITFDNQTGASSGSTFPVYPAFIPSTTMACWDQNIDIQNNTFDVGAGLQLPVAMDAAQRTSLEAKLFHKPDAACTGLLTFFLPVHNITQNSFFETIQPAIAAAIANDVIELSEWTFNEVVTIDKSLTLQGLNADKSLQVINGTGLGVKSGITINTGITGVTIKNLTVQNFTGVNGNSNAGIYAVGGNNNLTVTNVAMLNNPTASGFYANGPVDNVSITNSTAVNNGGNARGIVIWNGLKSNITITGNTVTNNTCCGIELQDGNASAVNISNNTIDIGGGDNAIGVVGLNTSVGANTINNNIITGGGRFGIEIKNPAGGVTVSGNQVTLSSQNADLRDRAGIAVMRRGVLAGNVDVPNGVSVTGNTVTGYQQTSTSEGFGIVIEGTNHTVTGNTVTGCEVGILQQQNPSNYPGDADQSNLADLFFGRGNSPITCGNTISGNNFSGNGINERNVPPSLTTAGYVVNTNTNTTYCSIQSAVNSATAGDVIEVSAAIYAETVTVNKALTIKGANSGVSGCAVRGPESVIQNGSFIITSNDVTIDGFELTGTGAQIRAGVSVLSNISIINNYIHATTAQIAIQHGLGSGGGIGSSTWTISGNKINDIQFAASTAIVAFNITGATIENNCITHTNASFTGRRGINADGLQTALIKGNTIDLGDTYPSGQTNTPWAVQIGLSDRDATNVTVTENTIQNTFYAIITLSQRNVNGLSITCNNLTGVARGVTLNSGSATPVIAGPLQQNITVENNTISSSERSFYARNLHNAHANGPVAFNNVKVINNSLARTTAGAVIEADAGLTINDGQILGDRNWFGSASYAVVAPLVVGSVTFVPFLLDGTDQDLSSICFVPNPLVLGIVHNVTQNTFHPTIQTAIDAASTVNGDVIEVPAGVYPENVTVNKSVEIRGPNYGINPNSGPRVAEAIVVPSVVAAGGEIFMVKVSNVKIDGLTIDGDNTTLTSGWIGTNGADIDAAEGVTIYDASPVVNNLIVSNNIIQNLGYFGVSLFGASNYSDANTSKTGHEITGNLIRNMGHYGTGNGNDLWGGGVLLYNSHYANISDNVMTNVRIGIQTGNYQTTHTGLPQFQVIDNNNIQTRYVGIFYNLHRYSPWTISNNTITGIDNATEAALVSRPWRGMLLASLGNNMGTSNISDNTIDGSAITLFSPTRGKEGINVWNVQNNASVNINGGTITGVGTGVFLNNYEGYSSNAADGAHATIANMSINAGTTGIRLFDSPNSTTHANVQATVTNNFITGGAEGVKLEETIAGKVTGTVNNNSITGQSGFAINGTTISNTVAATCNWYGSALFSGVQPLISGPVTYMPFLVNGTDDDLVSQGFQPVAGSCTGGMVENITQGTSYVTIQLAVAGAVDNDEIFAPSGTYAETVTVNKPLNIRGANSGVSACSTRVAESVLQNGSFIITSDGVTIDGFELTGTGAQIRADISVLSNVSILNNFIHATTAGQAILHGFGSGGGIGSTNWTISGNKIDNIQRNAATAIAVFNITNATITNNCITHTNVSFTGRRGINADGLQTATISGNTINMGDNYPSGDANTPWAVQISMSDRTSSGITMNGNIISNTFFGVVGLSQRSLTGFTSTNNEFTGVALGFAFNSGGTAPVATGTLMSNILLSNNKIASSNRSIFFRNLHPAVNGGVAFNNVDVNNNSLLRNTAGAAIEAASGLVINDASINATCNWYGSAIPSTVASRILGDVTYVQFLVDGTDNLVSIGFQPLDGACSGGVIITVKPDLTPTIDLPSNTFNPDQVKNAVLIVEEINNVGTAPGVTTFGLSAPVGYEILAYDGNLLEMAPSGGNTAPVNNTEFEVIFSNSAQVVFKAKAGVSIGARSFKAVGIQLKRTSALNGSLSNITINITTDPTLTYDSNDFNNIFSRILNAQ
jgi:hypothetical protein